MKTSRRSLLIGLASVLGVLASSCASGGRSMVQQSTVNEPSAQQSTVEPTYLAQSAVVNCLPRDPSMVCCIKKFPLTPMESCGATAVEVAEVLNGARVLNEAAQPPVNETAEPDGAKDAAGETTAPDDGWRQHCRDTYVACKDEKGWVGDCYACFRYCEGQQQWPFHLCTRKGKVR